MKKGDYSKSLLVISCGLAGLVVVAGGILTAVKGYADDDTSVDEVNIVVPESCSVEGLIVTGEEHTASIHNSQYLSEIGTTTFKTYCNDSSGYAIYAVGYSNDEYGNTLMKHDSDDTYDFDTGTADSGPTSDWAMKLTAVSGTYAPTIHSDTNGAFTAYHVVPSTYTKVVSFASNTDLPATGVNAIGSSFTSTYAVWISSSQNAGTYTGKVRYTLVHPASEAPVQPQTTQANKICYYANASAYEGTMGCQTIPASGTSNGVSPTSAILLASNFSRTGYGFAGWSDAYDYAANANAHFYGPQEYITFTAGQYSGTDAGLSLYAVWVKSAGNIQSWNGCSSLTRADQATNIFSQSITALTDQRDSQTYAVAKLADGQCWMIENLRLEAEDTRDASDIALSQGYNTTTFTGLADAESTNFSNSTATNYKNTSTAYYGADDSGAEIIISASDHTYSGTDYSGYSFPRYNNTNTSSRASTPTGNGVAMYSYGNYYTWAAAIADTAFYRTNNQSITNTSLCPTGWRLPQGGNKTRITSNDDNDFWNLTVDALNGGTNPANYDSSTYPYYFGTDEATPVDNKLRAFPNNFLYSGSFNTSSANNRGSHGSYWSSTAVNNNTSYYLYLGSSNVNPGTGSLNKSNGFSVRCVSGS